MGPLLFFFVFLFFTIIIWGGGALLFRLSDWLKAHCPPYARHDARVRAQALQTRKLERYRVGEQARGHKP